MILKQLREKNVILNYGAFFFRILAKSSLNFLLPKFLSVDNYSIYSILQANSSVISPSSVLGIPQILLRSGNIKVPILFYTLHSLFFATFLSVVIGKFYALNSFLIFLLFALACFQIFYQLFNSTLKGKQLFSYVFWAELAGFLTILGIALTMFLKNPLSLLMAVCFDITYAFIVGLVMLVFLIYHKSFTLEIDKIKQNLAPIYNVGYLIIIDSFCWRTLPLFFINYYSTQDPKYLAIFGLCMQISNALVLLSQAVIETWYPNFAILYHSDKKKYLDYFRVKSNQTFFIIAVIAPLGIILSFLLLKYFYTKYSEYAIPVAIMVFFRIISGFGDIYSAALYATSKEKILKQPVLIGIALLVILNVLLTSQNILWGAVISFSVARLFLSVMVMIYYKKTLFQL